MIETRHLREFCCRESERRSLHRPFSRGKYTYATNGHIVLRVPRREEVEEFEQAPAAEKLFRFDDVECVTIPLPKLPPPQIEICRTCNGRSTKHDCPDCGCECEFCQGRGQIDISRETSIAIGSVPFNLMYVRLMFALPAVRLPKVISRFDPMPFAFDGGDGLLMPRRVECANHLVFAELGTIAVQEAAT